MGKNENYLVDQFIAGDSESFSLIYEEQAPFLLSLAKRLVGHTAVAEDIVQEAFITLFRNRHKLQVINGMASIRAYLAKSVRNSAIHAYRSTVAQSTVLRQLGEHLPDSEDPIVFRAELEEACYHALRKAISSELSKTDQRVFELVILEELSVEEASRQLHLSKKTIDNARAKINSLLKLKLPSLAGLVTIAILALHYLRCIR